MKTILSFLFIISTILNFNIFSQWTLCPGSSNITGLGLDPVISVADYSLIAVAGGMANTAKVYLTTNHGINFINITGNLSGPELYAVNIRNSNMILVGDGGANGGVGGNAKVWKTTNKGINWNIVLTTGGTAGFINGIKFAQTLPNIGIIVSDGPTGSGILVYKTIDGGNNWISQNVGAGYNTVALGSIFVVNELVYGFGSYDVNKVTFTTNGGANWNFVNIPLTGTGILVDCVNQNCIAVTYSSLPNIYKFQLNGSGSTINTGIAISSASDISLPYSSGFGIGYLSALVGNNPLIKTLNYGTNWFQNNTAAVDSLSDIDCKYDGNAIFNAAVSTNNEVIISADILEGIIKTNELIPNEYKLEQNYPNPFNPLTSINFSIPIKDYVIISIFNAMGEIVSKPVADYYIQGNYTFTFDALKLPSGIYFCRMIAGNYVKTNKMILIK
ncbi:MAG: T9SS type A sorting domain-containing protein [Ignavibacteria bacterium]|nr:T9SS type A sorting domain-containing protein [Ignavibacteria bacterium]